MRNVSFPRRIVPLRSSCVPVNLGFFPLFLGVLAELSDDSVGGISITLRIDSTHFLTPRFNPRSNVVTNFAGALKSLLVSACKRRRIGKTPMQSRGWAGEDRAFLRAALITDRDDMGEKFSAL